MRRYLADLRRFGVWRLVLLGALTLVSALTAGIGLLMLVPLLELVGAGGGSGIASVARDAFEAIGLNFTLGWVLAFYVVLVAVRAVLVQVLGFAMMKYQFEFVDWQRLRLVEAIARADWLYHVKRRSSDVVHGVMMDIGRVGQGTNLMLDAGTNVILGTVYVVVAIRLSTTVTGLAAAVSLALAAVLWPLVRRSRSLGTIQTLVGRRAYGTLTELLSGMKLAKVHGAEDAHTAEFRSAITELRAAQLGFKKTQAVAGIAYQVGTAAALSALVWIGFEVVGVPTSQLLALIVVMSRILPIPGNITDDFRGAANMLPAYEHAMATFDEATAAAERAVEPSEPHVISEGIDIDHVRFSYPETDRAAVDDVTLHLPAHTTTALVGPSGAGKTTLADIVLGLISPDDGEIRVDGRPLDTIELGAWRAAISYVPQDPFLFHESLRSNVLWGTDGRSDAVVIGLLETVGLGRLLADLPEGLDTVVGERGHRLSGGERQRVVLARALARRPHLLVLDEATSHLDAESEVAARAAIDALHGELTVLVIAHRLGTVRHADQIAVLDHGRLCERGSWDELVGRRGRFSELLLAGGVPG